MHNCVRVVEYERAVLTCLHDGLFLIHLFAALVFVCIFLPWHELMAR
jgi:hypothetical protein